MKTTFNILICTGLLMLNGCYFFNDTADPQCSSSISESKKNDLFVAEYRLQSIGKPIFEVKEAWVEKSWKYKSSIFTPKRRVMNHYQLVFLIDNINDSNFEYNKYGISWFMENKLYGYLAGSYGGIINDYELLYGLSILPDTFHIIVERKDLDDLKIPYTDLTIAKK